MTSWCQLWLIVSKGDVIIMRFPVICLANISEVSYFCLWLLLATRSSRKISKGQDENFYQKTPPWPWLRQFVLVFGGKQKSEKMFDVFDFELDLISGLWLFLMEKEVGQGGCSGQGAPDPTSDISLFSSLLFIHSKFIGALFSPDPTHETFSDRKM